MNSHLILIRICIGDEGSVPAMNLLFSVWGQTLEDWGQTLCFRFFGFLIEYWQQEKGLHVLRVLYVFQNVMV